jgi:transposase-like protein
MAKKGSKFNKYGYEFKIMVVEDYLSGKNGGLRILVRKYGLKSHVQILNWLKKYKEDPSLLNKDLRSSNSKGGRTKSVRLEEMSLEEQNKYLRMENEILKKLKALRKQYGEH